MCELSASFIGEGEVEVDVFTYFIIIDVSVSHHSFTKEEIETYQELSKSVHDGRLIEYSLQYPKYRFLHFLSLKGNCVFHGSNYHNIERFEPRMQTLYNNKLTKAVFATTEPIWSIFYYSINESTAKNYPWTDGMLYILPREKFHKSGQGKVQFDEWICHEYVTPIGKINVSISNFWFFNKVAVHRDEESLFSTWLLYKIRALLVNSKKVSNSKSDRPSR